MDYKDVIRELIINGFSSPEIIHIVRQNAHNKIVLVRFLIGLRAPASAILAAGFPVAPSDARPDDAEVTRLVNTNLSSLGLFPTSVMMEAPLYGREIMMDNGWTTHVQVEDLDIYNLAVGLGYPHNAAAILSMSSPVWDSLKQLISCNVIPLGLSADGPFYVSRR